MAINPTTPSNPTPAETSPVSNATQTATQVSGTASLIGALGSLFAMGINNGTQAVNDAATSAEQNAEASGEQNAAFLKLLQG